MPLHVLPVTASDFPTLFTHASSPLGDLAAPITAIFFPLSTPTPNDTSTSTSTDPSVSVSASRTARLHASVAQQWVQSTTDPTARFVKVVDSTSDPDFASGEIVSLGRWHYYPDGWDLDEAAWREIGAGQERVGFAELGKGGEGEGEGTAAGMAGESDGLDARLAVAVNEWWYERRCEVLPEKQKGQGGCWALTTLITRVEYRKSGAGSMILQWGCDRADADGVPAFLEAVPTATGLYRKFGFEEVEPFHFYLGEFGGQGRFTLVNMRREPKGMKKEGEEEEE